MPSRVQYPVNSDSRLSQRVLKRFFSTLAVSCLAGGLAGLISPSAAIATPVVLRGQLAGHFIKVRSEPNVGAPIIAQQSVGVVAEQVDQLRQPNGRIWGRLQFDDGSLGWVPLDYWRPVTRLAPPTTDAPVVAQWTGRLLPAELGESIRVYPQPLSTGEPRYEATTGAPIQIFDSQVDGAGYLWYRVSLPSFIQGWVRADQVQQVRHVLR